MSNSYYTHGNFPASNAKGSSSSMRAEFDAVMSAFDLFPTPLGAGNQGFEGGRWDNPTITLGTIDGTPIGQTSPAAGTFTGLTSSSAGIGITTARVVFNPVAASAPNPAYITDYANALRYIGTSGAFDLDIVTNNAIRGVVNAAGRWLLGPAFTDDASNILQVNGGARVVGAMGVGGLLNVGGVINSSAGFIELGNPATVQSPFIDFHSSGASSDYDARITVNGGSASAGAGNLYFFAANHIFSQRPTFAGSVPWDHINLPAPVQGNVANSFTTTQVMDGGAGQYSSSLVFRSASNASNPYIRGNSAGYLEFISNDQTAVNLSLRNDGYATFRSGANFAVRPTWQGLVPWDNANLVYVSQLNNNMGYINSGATVAASNSVNGLTFAVSGQGGSPPWLWGYNNSAQQLLYSPSALNVSFANSAGSAGSVGGVTDPASKSFTGASTGIGVEIGPCVRPGTGAVDAGSPWVVGGIRVGSWAGPSGDCASTIYVRLTQVQQR